MASKTPMTVVLKTVMVGGVKLPTPADRIGLGFAGVTVYSAEDLSPGHFPLPHSPEPEANVGPRQELLAMQTREQTMAMATAAAPAGSAGCLSIPGSSAASSRWSRIDRPLVGWRLAAKWVGRASSQAGVGLLDRSGSDCQSPGRRDDRRPAGAPTDARASLRAWEMARPTAAGK